MRPRSRERRRPHLVAQVSNLLYRGFPIRKPLIRLPSAHWKSATRHVGTLRQAKHPPRPTPRPLRPGLHRLAKQRPQPLTSELKDALQVPAHEEPFQLPGQPDLRVERPRAHRLTTCLAERLLAIDACRPNRQSVAGRFTSAWPNRFAMRPPCAKDSHARVLCSEH